MSIKAVIFDLDGVIVSTDALHYKAWLKLAQREGIYFDEAINNRLRGVSRMASLEIILEKSDKSYTDAEKTEMATFKNDYYRTLLGDLTPADILPGVKSVLSTLKEKGYQTAIGSSSKNTKLILKQIGLDQAFDAIADGTDVKNSKPAPDVFLVAAEKLGLDPNVCAVVEDAQSGIKAAKNAGMTAYAISDALKSEIADYKLNQITDIFETLN